MRSTVSIKGMALALLIFFIGTSLFCYLFLYRPKIYRATKGESEVASLTGTVDKKMEELDKIKREIKRDEKEDDDRDYFKRYQIPPEERETTFLGMVNKLVNRLGIRTETVKPEPEQETPEHIRYPFLVETKAKYEEIVKFVDSLENGLGLNVDDLHIRNDPKDPLWHRLKFTVSTFESKEAESPLPDETPKEGPPPIEVEVRDDITVKRDPFVEKEEEKKKVVVARKPKERPPRRLTRLKLKGIIDIAGKKIAIINDTVVREGDWILKHRIVRIDEDKVILEYRGRERVLKIEDLLKTQKG
jgi:Tfp pilus assembly protein PilO